MRCVYQIAAQSLTDASRYRALGADPDKIVVTGNMKFDGLEVPEEIKTRPHLIRPAYQRIVFEYLAELRNGCDAYRVEYVRMDTSKPLELALSKYLVTRLQMGRL